MRRGRPPYPDLLTPREQEVLGLLREGLTNQEIANRLGISLYGARYHVSEILSKLGVSSREQAAAWQPETTEARRRFPVLRAVGVIAVPLRKLAALSPLKVVAVGSIGVAIAGVGLLAAGVLVMSTRDEAPAGAPPPTAEPGDLGKIVYASGGELWSKLLPDGEPALIAEHPGGAYLAPRWSPSGEWLSYEVVVGEAREVWISRADGTVARRLDALMATKAWSPVDDRLAYIDSNEDLIVEEADGSQRMVIVPAQMPETAPLLKGNGAPLWSPDGTHIAFARGGNGLSYQGIWVVDVATAQATELHREQPAAGESSESSGPLQPAAWSDDGEYVYFWRAPVFSASIEADGWPLWVASADGEIVWDLRTQTLVYADYLSPVPGSDNLVVTAGGNRTSTTNKQLVQLDVESNSVPAPGGTSSLEWRWSGLPYLLPGTAPVSPSVSPDAGQIAYAAGPDFQPRNYLTEPPNSRRIWLVDTGEQAGSERRLTSQEDHGEEYPRWSKDGTRILYVEPHLEREGEPSAVLRLADIDDTASSTAVGEFAFDLGAGRPYYGHIAWDQLFDWWQD